MVFQRKHIRMKLFDLVQQLEESDSRAEMELVQPPFQLENIRQDSENHTKILKMI